MERKITLLLVMVALLFCMTKVSCADSDSSVHIQDQFAHFEVVKGPNRRLLAFVDCGTRCNVRCSVHSRPNVCMRACGTCCLRCKCVPPGTYGNREMCGRCYTDMITRGNKPKCP